MAKHRQEMPKDPRKRVLQTFGGTVRRCREAEGLSQEKLAELSGLHRTYVSSLERGQRNVSVVNITKLAKALKVRPSELLDDLR